MVTIIPDGCDTAKFDGISINIKPFLDIISDDLITYDEYGGFNKPSKKIYKNIFKSFLEIPSKKFL